MLVTYYCIYTFSSMSCQSSIMVYTFSFMSVNHHRIYNSASSQLINFSIKQYVSQTSFHIYIFGFQSTNIGYIHSVFNQQIIHSLKQYVGQPSWHMHLQLYVSQPTSHLYIQFSVNQHIIQQSNLFVNHHCIYTFSFRSSRTSFSKPTSRSFITVSLHSVLNQTKNNWQPFSESSKLQ